MHHTHTRTNTRVHNIIVHALIRGGKKIQPNSRDRLARDGFRRKMINAQLRRLYEMFNNFNITTCVYVIARTTNRLRLKKIMMTLRAGSDADDVRAPCGCKTAWRATASKDYEYDAHVRTAVEAIRFFLFVFFSRRKYRPRYYHRLARGRHVTIRAGPYLTAEGLSWRPIAPGRMAHWRFSQKA